MIVKNDGSDYYIPSFGVETLTEMCGGEAYAVFLSGASDLTFTYPAPESAVATEEGMRRKASEMKDYKSRAHNPIFSNTGESNIIIIDDILGKAPEKGDQVRAYVNNRLVGSINIVKEHLNNTHPTEN